MTITVKVSTDLTRDPSGSVDAGAQDRGRGGRLRPPRPLLEQSGRAAGRHGPRRATAGGWRRGTCRGPARQDRRRRLAGAVGVIVAFVVLALAACPGAGVRVVSARRHRRLRDLPHERAHLVDADQRALPHLPHRLPGRATPAGSCWTCHAPGQDMGWARTDAGCTSTCHLRGGADLHPRRAPRRLGRLHHVPPGHRRSPSDPSGSPHHVVPAPRLDAVAPAAAPPGAAVTLTGAAVLVGRHRALRRRERGLHRRVGRADRRGGAGGGCVRTGHGALAGRHGHERRGLRRPAVRGAGADAESTRRRPSGLGRRVQARRDADAGRRRRRPGHDRRAAPRGRRLEGRGRRSRARGRLRRLRVVVPAAAGGSVPGARSRRRRRASARHGPPSASARSHRRLGVGLP